MKDKKGGKHEKIKVKNEVAVAAHFRTKAGLHDKDKNKHKKGRRKAKQDLKDY